jgi:hypothetical protein
VNKKQLIIFAIIFTIICTLGSAYTLKEETKPQEIHTPQRKIERQLAPPDETSFNDTLLDDRSIQ